MEKSILISLLLIVYFILVGIYGMSYNRQFARRFTSKFKSSKSPLITVTPQYTANSYDDPTNESYNIWNENCSWMNYQSNEDFFAAGRLVELQEKLTLESTGQIYDLDEKNQWTPMNFGYTEEQGKRVFPDFTYPKWDTLIQGTVPNISLDYSNEVMTMDWNGNYLLPTYDPRKLTLIKDFQSEEQKEYQGLPVKLDGTQEFVFARWKDSPSISNAVLTPRKNDTAYDNTMNKQKQLDNSAASEKPLIILLMTVDSFSRRHFFRKMQNTIDYMNQLNAQQNYTVFDFKLHNLKGGNSIENMVPILGSILEKGWDDKIEDRDILGKDALWNILRDLGFISVMAIESCELQFTQALGEHPQLDHLVRSFYWLAAKELGMTMQKDEKTTQRWIGPAMSHTYILNYTQEITRLYPRANLFIYDHLDTAHEETGQHAATLDEDMQVFLQEYLQEFGDDRDVVVLLHADHGMRYGNWFTEVEAFQENKLPAFFLIAPRKYLETFPNAYDVLQHNTLRLTTKQDLRQTILELAHHRYGMPRPISEDLDGAISIISQKSTTNRTCDDISVKPEYWSWLTLEEIDEIYYDQKYKQRNQLRNLLQAITREAVQELNSIVNTPYSQSGGLGWQKLSLNRIKSAFAVKLSTQLEQFRIQFLVNEHPTAIFEVVIIVGTDTIGQWASSYEKGAAIPYIRGSFKGKARIFGFVRKDKYAGPWENVTRQLNLKAEL